MKVISSSNSLNFSGVLDENTSKTQLTSALNSLRMRGADGPITVNFSKVMYANSTGIITWLQFLNKSQAALKYIDAPLWLVDHFNLLRGFFEFGSYVESLQAPYAAPETQESRAYLLTLGSDVPILEDYSKVRLPNKIENGVVYEPDFSPQRHFSFIAENYPIFKEKFKA